MSFVKLDCGILDSSLWFDLDGRDIFLTALLMASPVEFLNPQRQLEVQTMTETGFIVPPGWYGLVSASGLAIVSRSKIEIELGMAALERLGKPEPESRSPQFEGRRLARIAGGYVVLNFISYRDKDHTAALRAKRYRLKKAKSARQVKSSNLSREARFVKASEDGDSTKADSIAAEDLPVGAS